MEPWLARNLCYRPATWLRGEPVFRLLRRYESSQWWSPERLREEQESALGALLRYATERVPYYRRAAAEAGLEPAALTARDLDRLPLLHKTDLVSHAGDLLAPQLPGTTSWKTTGGSTGEPVRVRKNRSALAAEQAASWRSYGWYGIQPGDRQARFWGVAFSRRARWRYRAIDFVLNRRRFSAFGFGRDELRAYFDELAGFRPAWVYGYASMLEAFASFCAAEDLPLAALGVRAVVSTSEALGPEARERIGAAFGAPVFDEYGCGEVGPILYECEQGSLHLMAENLFVELAPDPTPSEPEARRLILTDLHNRAMPLIRYDVADRVVPAPPCGCGRGLTPFRRVFGRAYDFIPAADGARFHGEFFLYLLEAARDRGIPIRQAQFVEAAPGSVEIRIVPAPGYDDEMGRALAQELAARSEGRLRAEARVVDEIPRERSGKIRLIRAKSATAPAATGPPTRGA